MTQHQGLPVHGYKTQPAKNVDLVNVNKILEERCLRRIDELLGCGASDPRWLAIGKTHLEQAFMAINRSIFRPQRVELPEDEA